MTQGTEIKLILFSWELEETLQCSYKYNTTKDVGIRSSTGGGGGGGGGGIPYKGLDGEAPPQRGNFFRPQGYEMLGILLVEVFERVGKSVIWVELWKGLKGLIHEFYGFIKWSKRSVFGTDSFFKKYTCIYSS